MIKLFRLLKPYIWSVLAIVGFLFLQAMAELYLPTLMSEVVNNGMMKGDTGYIWKYGAYMLLVALGSSICAIICAFLSARVGLAFGRDLRNYIFMRVESYSLHEFDKAGRQDLVEKVRAELAIVELYMPKQLSDDELSEIVKEAILEIGANSKADMGKVMAAIMPKVKGKADGSLVNKLVQQHLS
jgi:ABC-type multidrug transport system fused ATPase/permease subunit